MDFDAKKSRAAKIKKNAKKYSPKPGTNKSTRNYTPGNLPEKHEIQGSVNAAGDTAAGSGHKKGIEDATKNASSGISGEAPEYETESDQALFSNLKKETDEILEIKKTFSKRQIFSNWAKYTNTEPSVSEDTDRDVGIDFHLLQDAAVTGGYFRFKNENWYTQADKLFSKYFVISADLYGRSLSCIPAYEKIDIPKNLFTENEIKKIDNYTKTKRLGYESFMLHQKAEVIEEDSSALNPSTYCDSPMDKNKTSSETVPTDVERIPKMYKKNQIQSEPTHCIKGGKAVQNMPTKVGVNTVDQYGLQKTSTVAVTPSEQETCLKTCYKNSEALSSLPIQSDQQSKTADGAKFETVASVGSCEPQPDVLPVMDNIAVNPLPQRTKGKTRGEVKAVSVQQRKITTEEDDDIDFLLSLKKPVASKASVLKPVCGVQSKIEGSAGKVTALNVPRVKPAEKKQNLDDWLDAICDEIED